MLRRPLAAHYPGTRADARRAPPTGHPPPPAMPRPRIAARLDDADVQAVLDLIAQARAALPFLVNLTLKERRAMGRFGEADLPFVRTTAEVGRQHPDVLPRRVDVEAQAGELALYERLDRVRLAVTTLGELVRDTQRVLAADMYGSARDVYAAVQRSRGESDALDAVYRDLARHFNRPARPADEGEPDDAPDA